MSMLRNYDEIPHTIEGLKFYIKASNRAIDELKIKLERLEALRYQAIDSLRLKEEQIK